MMLVKTVKASWSCRFWLALASFLLPRRQSPNRQYFLLQWSVRGGRAQPTKAEEALYQLSEPRRADHCTTSPTSSSSSSSSSCSWPPPALPPQPPPRVPPLFIVLRSHSFSQAPDLESGSPPQTFSTSLKNINFWPIPQVLNPFFDTNTLLSHHKYFLLSAKLSSGKFDTNSSIVLVVRRHFPDPHPPVLFILVIDSIYLLHICTFLSSWHFWHFSWRWSTYTKKKNKKINKAEEKKQKAKHYVRLQRRRTI